MFMNPPDAPGSFSRPSLPYCLNGYQYSGTHTCDKWEINNYVNEINDYISDLYRYAQEAQNFAQNAAQFAADAALYAECEAEQAKGPIN